MPNPKGLVVEGLRGKFFISNKYEIEIEIELILWAKQEN